MNKSVFITLPKVCGTAICEKHRTMSLMRYVTKLVPRVIMKKNIPHSVLTGDVNAHSTLWHSYTDITKLSSTLYNQRSWTTQHALSSYHLPIITTIKIRDMTTDYNKTDGHSPTTRKLTGHNLRKTQSPLSLRPPYPPIYILPT